MKLCISLFPLLYVFFLFVFFTSIYAAENYNKCQNNYMCGDLSVGYPFWGGDRPVFCGPPGFNLSCIEDKDEPSGGKYTAIDINGMRFRVIEIIQSDNRLIIARSDLWEIPCSNDGLKNDTSLAYTFFNYTESANENLTLFYGCSGFEEVEANLAPRFNCSENGEIVIHYLKDSLIKEFEGNVWLNDCYKKSIKVCILKLNLEKLDGEGFMNPQTYINEGFDVEYPADIAKMCSDCEDGGQLCAYNGSFVCANKTSGRKNSVKLRIGRKSSVKLWIGRKSSVKLWIVIAAGMTCAVLLIICAVFCLIRSKNESMVRWKKTPADRKVEAFLRQHGSLAPKRYTYSEIKRITGSFKEKLGKGGFGDVYKGKIPNGRLVAVKLLHISKGNGEDFMNEVASISSTSHVNVVTLLGFCLQGRRRALVYEFMPNGSLEKFVYTDKTLHSSQQLGWEKLYQITIGIARGLEYLHRGCNTRILHFDIKPHNILLDEKFSPKISDFGLAKLCSTNDSKISMLEARGTIGYIAPEMFSRNFGPVSHKSDVYSYGMMVLEMVGGRKNLNVGVSNTSEIYFPHWIYKRLELGTEFQGLQGLTTGEETEIVRKMILVGLWCIQPNPSDRPAISKVIEMLEGSIGSLDIPPRPFLSSPPRPPPPESMSDSTTTLSSICTSKN